MRGGQTVHAHLHAARGGVTLAEPRKRCVGCLDFKLEGPFAQSGVLQVEGHTLVELHIGKMFLEDDIGVGVLLDGHRHCPDARLGVFEVEHHIQLG